MKQRLAATNTTILEIAMRTIPVAQELPFLRQKWSFPYCVCPSWIHLDSHWHIYLRTIGLLYWIAPGARTEKAEHEYEEMSCLFLKCSFYIANVGQPYEADRFPSPAFLKLSLNSALHRIVRNRCCLGLPRRGHRDSHDRSRPTQRPSSRCRPTARGVSRPPYDAASRGRKNHPMRVPKRARQGPYPLQTQLRWRFDLVGPPSDPQELGNL